VSAVLVAFMGEVLKRERPKISLIGAGVEKYVSVRSASTEVSIVQKMEKM
jgi:hypothetical protein